MPTIAPEAVKELLAWLAALGLTVTATTLSAYHLFKYLGSKWVEAKFSERLEAFKHEQQKEIEQLKFRINGMLDRATKLHQREFDVIPEAWGLLTHADGLTTAVTSALQSYPDLEGMSAEQLEALLDELGFAKWERIGLEQAPDKNKYLQRRTQRRCLGEAQNATRELLIYLRKTGIFMPERMRDKFRQYSDMLWGALIEHEINERMGQLPRERAQLKRLLGEGPALFEALEAEVHSRLWDSKTEKL